VVYTAHKSTSRRLL